MTTLCMHRGTNKSSDKKTRSKFMTNLLLVLYGYFNYFFREQRETTIITIAEMGKA